MRTYVSPIGWNSTSVTRPVLDHGIGPDDRVVLLRPRVETDDSRAEAAITDVERLLREIEPTVDLAVERLAHDEYAAAVRDCLDVLQAAEGDRIVNLGGGARDVLLPLVTAALASADRIDTVLFFSDIDGAVRELTLPVLTAAPSASALDTLATIAENGGEMSIPELTAAADASKSTITRHVADLEDGNLVETWREGKVKCVRTVLAGEVRLAVRP
jgi:CRISPR-associated protein Csa3